MANRRLGLPKPCPAPPGSTISPCPISRTGSHCAMPASQPRSWSFTWLRPPTFPSSRTTIKTIPEGWCVDYDCKMTLTNETKVGLLGPIPKEDVTYLIRGRKVPKLLQHDYVTTLDLSAFPDVKPGEDVTI